MQARKFIDSKPSERGRTELIACFVLIGLGAIYTFRGALSFYFAQEDFRGLAVGAGVYPRHAHLWRYVSVQAFMDVFYPLFRDRAWPYHAVSLALHGLNSALLFILLSRWLAWRPAFVGASFFAVHPALFTALYWQSARADLMADTFGLLTVLLWLRPGRERWLAVPTFALSLLSKESTLLLPAVIVLLELWRGRRDPTARMPGRDRLIWALCAMSAAYFAYLIRPRAVGVQVGFDPGAAYALDFGSPLFRNFLTYVGWAVDLAMIQPGLRFVDRQNPAIFPLAIGVLIVSSVLATWPALRRRGWLVGFASFALLLVPVLPLRNHAYHYYLYVPLMAAALCVAALADTVLRAVPSSGPKASKRAHGRTNALQSDVSLASWVIPVICWLALVWNGDRVVKQIETRPSPVYPGLRGDPIVDRAIISEHALTSLRAARIPNGTELVMILRERIALLARIVRGSGEEPPPTQEVYPETNVKAALFEGYAIRALVPGVDSVRFSLGLGQPKRDTRYGVYAPTGEVEVYDAASIDSLLRSSWVTRW